MKDLIQQIKKGDKNALAELYEAQREPFINWMRGKYSISEEDVLDVYQESIIALYRNILDGKLTELKSRVSTYLFAIGKNIWLNRHRKMDREIAFTFKFTDEHQKEVKVNEMSIEAYHGISSELLKVVSEMVVNMADPCYSILKLSLLYDLSTKEILKQLDYKNASVLYTQKNRCLKKVQALIKQRYTKEDFLDY